jgi:hypothetical protein
MKKSMFEINIFHLQFHYFGDLDRLPKYEFLSI